MGVIGIDAASIIPGVVVYDKKIITWVTLFYQTHVGVISSSSLVCVIAPPLV